MNEYFLFDFESEIFIFSSVFVIDFKSPVYTIFGWRSISLLFKFYYILEVYNMSV